MFDKVIQKYPNAKPIFHSDRGFQYIGNIFKNKIDEVGILKVCLELVNVYTMVLWKGFLVL